MMRKVVSILLLLVTMTVFAQDRFAEINRKLDRVAQSTPGLDQTVNFSVAGATVQEFLRGIAESNELNVSVDPDLDIRVYNKFTNEKVRNIILFLCREYGLDVHFQGSIMSFVKYEEAIIEKAPEVYAGPKVSYAKGNDKLTLRLDSQKDELEAVVQKINEITSYHVVSDSRIPNGKMVKGTLIDTDFKKAMKAFAITNGLESTVNDDGVFVLSLAPVEETQVSNKRTNSRNKSGFKSTSKGGKGTGQINDLTVVDSAGVMLIDLDAQNIPIGEAIQAVSAEAQRDYFMFSEPAGNATTILHRVTYEEFLTHILQGTEHTYKKEGELFLVGERKLEGLRTTKVVTLQYRSFTDVMNVIPTELRQGVEINEFQELNSFIMSGSAPQINEIEAFVRQIDQIVPMVMIEVILVDVKRGKDLKTGISAGLADTSSGGSLLPGLNLVLASGTINRALSGANVNIGRVTNNFYVGLSALEEMDYANVRSMPKLATLNGHEATMSIGETRYYKLQTQNVVGNLTNNTIVTDQWNSVQADLSITIKPVISGDDHVTLDIDVGISDFVGNPPNNQPPPSTTRQFTSLVRVKDQEMVLLGGMERTAKAESGTGVPVLSRIPVIKWFFSSKSKTKSKSISFVFIKPIIIH